MRTINETVANFNPNTGPATATIDITYNWVDDAGTPHSQTFTGETLAAAWGDASLTARDKAEAFFLVMRFLTRKIATVDAHI